MTASNSLTVNVSGSGHLLILENGNSLDHTPGSCETRNAHYGKFLAIVQSNRNEVGSIHVEVNAEGLESQAVDIKTV